MFAQGFNELTGNPPDDKRALGCRARASPRKLETEDASLSRNLRDTTIATFSRVLYLPSLGLVGTRYAPTSMTHFLATFPSFASICAMARQRAGEEGDGGGGGLRIQEKEAAAGTRDRLRKLGNTRAPKRSGAPYAIEHN